MRRVLIVAVVLASALSVIVVWAGGVRHMDGAPLLPLVRRTRGGPSLDANVTVRRDRYGVPQLYADTAEDLFTAQGYVHAQDRFWQMDVRRHITAGRLAELFGEDQVERDTFLRTLGWRRVAEEELAILSPETRRWLGRTPTASTPISSSTTAPS